MDFLCRDYITAGLTPGQYIQQQLETTHGAPATWTPREPTGDEQAAARTLAARLAEIPATVVMP